MDTIKVLVVEDEVLLLRNIMKKISASDPDFSVIGSAYNGKEALELIEKLHPQIIFTDIRMPIMDGLELSRIIQKTHPEIFIVIISGYDDFDYARAALTCGVKDYLLKPLQTEPLAQLLSNLKAEITTAKNSNAYHLLYKQVNGLSLSDQDTSHSLLYSSSSFQAFLVCFGNLQIHYYAAESTQDSQAVLDTVDWKALMKALGIPPEKWWLYPTDVMNMRLLLMETQNLTPDSIAQSLIQMLCAKLEPIPINISYSACPLPIERLHTTVQTLRKRLYSRLCIGKSQLFADSCDNSSCFPPAVLPHSMENHLNTLLQSGNITGLRNSIITLFEDWKLSAYPQQWIEKILHQIIMLLQQKFYFSEDDFEHVHTRVYLHLEENFCITDAAGPIADEFLYWIQLNKSVPTEIENAIEQMDEYIRNHYTEPINLLDLAQQYHFNQSYLTRLFKKIKGQTPQKLINSLRMADARKLLENPSLSVREISEMLGYTDQHYFSRIFKESMGQTPKEFRS